MRSRFTRLRYRSIAKSPYGRSIRLASAAGILAMASLVAACGGGSEDASCDDLPDNVEKPEQCNGGDGTDDGTDDGNDGGTDDGNDDGNDGGTDDGNDGGTDDGNDGGTDDGNDGGTDDGNDGGTDDGNDGGTDDGNDGGTDDGNDGGTDGGTGDEDTGGDDEPTQASKPPRFDDWKERMSTFGNTIGQQLDGSTDRKIVYYDGQRVFFQIAEFLGEEEPWHTYAQRARDRYEQYIFSQDDGFAGKWRFTHGFLMNYQINGVDSARDSIVWLRDNLPFSDSTPSNPYSDGWFHHYRSREVAYSLQSQIDAEKAGEPRQEERLNRLVEMALNHIEIWTTGNFMSSDPDRQFVQAFMTGLTATALIEYYEHSVERGEPDDRILPAVRKLADWLWSEMWVADVDGTGYGAFEYVQPTKSGVGSESPAGDLNMLIVPMYGWLYKETGESRFLERGDKIFAGGVELAYLGDGKQFNQNYRDSFSYIEWREEGIERHGE